MYGKVSQVDQVPSLTNSTRENEQFICHFMWFSDILRYLTNRTELMTNRPNLITNKYQNLYHLIKARTVYKINLLVFYLDSIKITHQFNNSSELILKTSKTFQSKIIASKSIIIIEQSFMLHFYYQVWSGTHLLNQRIKIDQTDELQRLSQIEQSGWQIRLNEISHEQALEINSLFVICTLFYL
ncbi:Hypothetical_protein [Hexamita inflata]|uniref:Hypothetical_protein n=1 Tax=Hexamita inflata TaxID=28002 RepID=A0ABP1HMT4_9EUKA